jgi:hypothetical protein
MMRAQSGIGFSGGGIGLKSSGVLAQSAVAASVTGTLTETVLATIAIPAGAIGVNGGIRVTSLWSYTNSADSKSLRSRFNGTNIGTSFSVTTSAQMHHQFTLWNRGAANSQVATTPITASYGTSGNSPATSTIDTSASVSLTLTGQINANAGSNTITLESYTVEIMNL